MNFSTVYTGNTAYASNNKITKLEFKDTIDSNLEIVSKDIYIESKKVTNRFNITENNNVITATLKKDYFDTGTSYNCIFTLKIIVKLKSSGVKTKLIKNKATVEVNLKNNPSKNTTNEVSTSVYYNIQGNIWVEKYKNNKVI